MNSEIHGKDNVYKIYISQIAMFKVMHLIADNIRGKKGLYIGSAAIVLSLSLARRYSCFKYVVMKMS